MNKIELPKDYEPYETMLICGNTFTNGFVPIAVDDHPIFLLGKGHPTKIWLQIRSGDEWHYEITPEHTDDSAFTVTQSDNVTSVYFGAHYILRSEEVDENRVKVDHLDFTPFGLAIHGDATVLYLGTNRYLANSFSGMHTMINVR